MWFGPETHVFLVKKSRRDPPSPLMENALNFSTFLEPFRVVVKNGLFTVSFSNFFGVRLTFDYMCSEMEFTIRKSLFNPTARITIPPFTACCCSATKWSGSDIAEA